MPRFCGAGYAPVAQLDRVSDSDSEGRWFESSRAYQKSRMRKRSGFYFLQKPHIRPNPPHKVNPLTWSIPMNTMGLGKGGKDEI